MGICSREAIGHLFPLAFQTCPKPPLAGRNVRPFRRRHSHWAPQKLAPSTKHTSNSSYSQYVGYELEFVCFRIDGSMQHHESSDKYFGAWILSAFKMIQSTYIRDREVDEAVHTLRFQVAREKSAVLPSRGQPPSTGTTHITTHHNLPKVSTR